MKKFVLLFLISTSFMACKKYEDDSYVTTFKSPENRMINRWDVGMVIENKEDVSERYVSYYMTFSSDNRCAIKYVDTINGEAVPTVKYGNWRLTNNDKNLEINVESFYSEYEILELSSKNLSLRSVNLVENRLMHLSATN